MLKNFFFCTYKKTNWVEIVLPLGPKFLWLWRSPELYWRQIAAIVPKFPSPRAHLKCAWTHFLSCSPNFDHIVSKPNQPKKETKKIHFPQIHTFWKFTYLILNIGKIHFIQVTQHLVDLRRILQNCSCGLSQMVQSSVPSQSLRQRSYSSNLNKRRISLETKRKCKWLCEKMQITLIALSCSGRTSLSAELSHPSRFLEKERMHCVKLLGMGFNTCNCQTKANTSKMAKYILKILRLQN